MIVKQLCTLYFLVVSILVLAQDSKIDSLEHQLLSQHDTLKVKTLNNLVEAYEFVDTTKAWTYCRQSMQLATTIKYAFGHLESMRLAGILCADVTDYKKARIYFNRAIELYTPYNGRGIKRVKRGLALTRHWVGVTYEREGEYEAALTEYLAAAKVFEESKEVRLSFYTYLNLIGLKFNEKDYAGALKYAHECLAIGKKLSNNFFLAHAHMQVASANTFLKNFALSLNHLDSAEFFSKNIPDKHFIGHVYYLRGKLFNDQGKQSEAVQNYTTAIDYIRQMNDKFQLAGLLQELGECYTTYGQLSKGEATLQEALALSIQFGLKDVARYTYKNLSTLREKQNNKSQALDYLKKYVALNDSILSEKSREQMRALESKFQAERKENQILQLEKDKQIQVLEIQQKSNLNFGLAGIIFLVLLISIFIYRSYKQSKVLHQQRINELQIEKQLMASESVLRGQEGERTRMARDLHDGLGGILSGIKHTFSAMKINLVMTTENQLTFEHGIDMLDVSIGELRRVAHNMMPESLVNFGLATAVNDFCQDIRASGGLAVVYQPYGMEGISLPENVSIGSYRIIQELINNAMKHAKASSLLVQLSYDGKQLLITVEDNGVGMSDTQLSNAKGMGWSNIYSRVNYLKGRVDVQSEIGKGTSVAIAIPC